MGLFLFCLNRLTLLTSPANIPWSLKCIHFWLFFHILSWNYTARVCLKIYKHDCHSRCENEEPIIIISSRQQTATKCLSCSTDRHKGKGRCYFHGLQAVHWSGSSAHLLVYLIITLNLYSVLKPGDLRFGVPTHCARQTQRLVAYTWGFMIVITPECHRPAHANVTFFSIIVTTSGRPPITLPRSVKKHDSLTKQLYCGKDNSWAQWKDAHSLFSAYAKALKTKRKF